MINYKFKTKPYKHQLEALERSWDKSYFAYFMEMGTGKSKVLIDNCAMLYDKGEINGLLLIAPKGVYKNWYEQEIPQHLPKHIEKKMVLWKTSDKSGEQTKKLNTLFATGTDFHILIMNVEAFSYPFGCEFARRFLSSHKAMMAIDESTSIKTPKAKRTQNIIKLKELSPYRRILTGSPVTNSPLDLFSQCQFLGPWLLKTDSYFDFRSRYSVMKSINLGSRTVQVVIGHRNLGELSKLIEPFSMRVLKDDCLDLPPKTYMKRTVEMTDQQEKVYKAMKKYAMAELEGKVLTTSNVMVQLMRLHQITCGHFTADDGTISEIPCRRVDELLDILSEVEGKVVIWSHFQKDVQRIIKEIKKKYESEDIVVDYYGLTPPEERQNNIKKFQENDKCRFFVGTTQTGGYGITLTAASTMIYFSNGYDLEKRLQSEARIDRIGQEYPMTYIDIVTENTMDDKVVKALRKKVNIATEIMGEELKEWI
jgi:SNF2 family DNA or RNA helicase|tara:strand:+ start:7404 stop:8843 length:1440 start_codon:yes stop_codon:yes gene_type:complete